MEPERVHRLSDVYGTSRDVPLTYQRRSAVDDRFLNDITRDKHIVIHGSSKQGKTCLRKYHLNEDDYVVVQCTRESTKASLYEMVLKHAGVQTEVTQSRTIKGGFKVHAKVSGEAGLKILAKAAGETGGEYNRANEQTTGSKEFDIDPEDANDVVRVLKAAEFRKYIVVEDFHYLDEDIQRSLAIDLKVFHETSDLIFIVVGVWLEANKLTLFNGDLGGRITTINADNWTTEELQRVIENGEPLLNVEFNQDAKLAVVEGCQSNVGLLQEVCFRICEENNVWQTSSTKHAIGTVQDVQRVVKAVADEQAARYNNFLSKFSEGLGETQLEMYRWLAYAIVTAKVEELRRGLRANVLFQRIRDVHPSKENLQQNNVQQALDRVGKVQFKHKLQPLILDYSNGELIAVDANFLVFLQTHSRAELLQTIGLLDPSDQQQLAV